mmetsp:Transcript_10575/g.19259  ORF Transcript_10575/g.19259 Transcript_10575/m.19259 type:complete len:234 (-) Transcript_10575:25-726(-)
MIEWNGEKLIKLCGKVKLERRLFPPDPNRPDLPPSRPPGPTTPNTGGGTLPAISPFGGTSLSNILDNDVSLGHAMIIASALNNNNKGGMVDLNMHLGGVSPEPVQLGTMPGSVPILYFKRKDDQNNILEVPPLLVNGVSLKVDSYLSEAAEMAHRMSSGSAVLAKKRDYDTFLTIERESGPGIQILIDDSKKYKIKNILQLDGVESNVTIWVEWKKSVELTEQDRYNGIESLF